MGHSAGVARIWAICFLDADFDRTRRTVLSRGNECCIGLRRRTLFYLLVSASIALPSVDAFSNPTHKHAAPHPSKTVKAEDHKHRVGTQSSHRNKTAETENHKHRAGTQASHRIKRPKQRITSTSHKLRRSTPSARSDRESCCRATQRVRPIRHQRLSCRRILPR